MGLRPAAAQFAHGFEEQLRQFRIEGCRQNLWIEELFFVGNSGCAHLGAQFFGAVHAVETLELQSSSRVKGDVHYKSIEMHQGAIVEGRLVHQDGGVAGVKTIELKLASGA